MKQKVNILLLMAFWAPQINAYANIDITSLSLKELGKLEITSVSRKAQKKSDVASAISVLTHEDLKRAGINHIADALRMIPGVYVARLDSSKWSVSIRGNSDRFSNKLLVLVDGRSAYIPSFSGVYWETTDVNINDIERIEVIRGPGATVWGANAVNGVINIITKNAKDTTGPDLDIGAGNLDKTIGSARYGYQVNENNAIRAYGKYKNLNNFDDRIGRNQGDSWNFSQAGFRWDWDDNKAHTFKFQTDAYHGNFNEVANISTLTPPFSANVKNDIDASGWNVLGLMTYKISNKHSFELQAYFNKDKRNENWLNQVHKTFDIELNAHSQVIRHHDLSYGIGFRHIKDHFDNSYLVAFLPVSDTFDLLSAYIQDEITLKPETFFFTIGTKVEHNDFTGSEVQPSARFAYLRDAQTFWLAVSKAVRTPSRAEDGISFLATTQPGPPLNQIATVGNKDFKAEKVWSYEAGYRLFFETFSIDVAAFYSNYNLLRASTMQPPYFANGWLNTDLRFTNDFKANTYGLEIQAQKQMLDNWRLIASYNFLDESYDQRGQTDDVTFTLLQVTSPKHQFSLRSLLDLSEKLALDVWVRYTDTVKNSGVAATFATSVPSILTADVRLGYKFYPNWELSALGQNLFDKRHLEGVQIFFNNQTYVPRGYFIKINWNHK